MRSVGSPPHECKEADGTTDLEPTCTSDIPPLLPEGEYEVVFVRAEEKVLWGRPKVFLQFRIMRACDQACDAIGQKLFMAATLPKHGRLSISSKYLQQWILASGRRPARRDRLSTRVFQQKVFLATVRTVRKGSDGSVLPVSSQYSVIDRLLKVLTGAA